MIVPAIYICKGNYGLFFKKVRLRDIKTIILCFIGYLVYGALVGYLLHALGVPVANDASVATTFGWAYVASLLIKLVGEEFFKVFLLLLVMYLVYRVANNRDLAIGIGIVITLFVFGIAHMSAYGNIVQILLIQGVGTIFNLYAYMKTKNVIVSYIIHIMIDFYGYFAVLASHALM